MKRLTSKFTLFVIVCLSLAFTSCSDFLNADPNRGLIDTEKVFSNDVTATAAATEMYTKISGLEFLTGGPPSVNTLSGFCSAELFNYSQDQDLKSFEVHSILAQSNAVSSVWSNMYNEIYLANALIEGIHGSKSLSLATANQLEGEGLFMRAFCYFYLVNLFGDVPLVTSTDYNRNRILPRSAVGEVYKSIENDLLKAQTLLSESYVTSNKGRPNKYTASALLARVYLYQKEYAKAESMASSVIESGVYQLNTKSNINSVFLVSSPETIWQIMQILPSKNTPEGSYFIISVEINSTSNRSIVTSGLLDHFESGDLRKANWIGSYVNPRVQFFYPFKYKKAGKTPDQSFTEASIAFRLAEMYLIRAEARVWQGKLVGGNSALTDLNTIRSRAGLTDAMASDKEALLLAIENERWSELFTEYGHRWLDLKRTGRALAVLGNGIAQTDLLWPIPLSEFQKNPALGTQNPGYQN
jgi:hypothetical protein